MLYYYYYYYYRMGLCSNSYTKWFKPWSLSPFWLVAFSPFWLNLSPLWPQLSPIRLSPFQRVAGDQLNDRTRLLGFFAYKNVLVWNDMRTDERKEWQSIQIIWDISRDDRARIATCSLRTVTDRFNENSSIDINNNKILFIHHGTPGVYIIFR